MYTHICIHIIHTYNKQADSNLLNIYVYVCMYMYT